MISFYSEQVQLFVFVLATLPLLIKRVPIKFPLAILTFYNISIVLLAGLNTSNLISTILLVCLYFLLEKDEIKSLLYIAASGMMLNSKIGYEALAILIVIEMVNYYFSNKKEYIKLPLLFVFLISMMFVMQLTGALNFVDIFSFTAIVSVYFILHLFYFERLRNNYAEDFIQNIILTFSLINILDVNIVGVDIIMLILISTFIGIKLYLYFLGKRDKRYTFKVSLLLSFAYVMLTNGESLLEIQLLLLLGYFLSSINIKNKQLKKIIYNFILTPSPFNMYFISIVLLFSSSLVYVNVLKILLCTAFFVPYLLLRKQETLVLES